MDRDDIDDLLDDLDAQTPDTDDSDLSSEISSEPSTLDAAGENKEQNSLFIDGKEYVETKNLGNPTRKGGGKTSSVWKLGVELKRVDNGAKFWQCVVCKRRNKSTIYTATATTGPFRHLKSEHGIMEKNKRFVRIEKREHLNSKDSSIIQSFNHQTSVSLFSKTLIEDLRLLFLQWIICCHLALSMIENRFFLAFIGFINRTVLDYIPKSSDTLRKWVISEYQRQKEIKKETIRRSRSRISISFDTWTAPFAKKHIISVIAHFVDENWERRHLQLSMSRLYGGHSGASVAAHIVPILRDWGIDERTSYFITDNEAANGTAIDHILGAIDPTYKKADRPKRWIRCLPHTLNLVAQAFLLGDNRELFQANVYGAELSNNLEELQKLWRGRGFIGKLMNIIRSIRISPKQRVEFERIKVNERGDIEWLAAEDIEDERQLELISNNKTRWNSTLMMLKRAAQCQTRLQAYCSNWLPSTSKDDDSSYDLREDILSPEEWKGVREVIKVLKPLLYYTKVAEQRDVGLQDWVPIVDKLTSHFYEASQRFQSMADESPVYEWLHICCEKAWEKLNDYYKLADKSPLYYTAMVMDPSLKYAWFEQRWNEPPKRNWIPGE